LNNNILIFRRNVIPSFGTYRSLAAQAEQTAKNNNSDKRSVIDERTIRRIEKLSLVGFKYDESKKILEEAVMFTERLQAVHIDETVRPMYNILENEYIHLRDDELQDDIGQYNILKNAAVSKDGYFVAPLVMSKSNSE